MSVALFEHFANDRYLSVGYNDTGTSGVVRLNERGRKGCGGPKALNAIVLPGALALALALTAMTAAGAQSQPNVEGLLVRVGERVAEFYERAKNVICIETSTVQPV